MHALGVRVQRHALCERWEGEGTRGGGGEGDRDAFGGRAGGSGREGGREETLVDGGCKSDT
jgi:hypothetical protein